ncbi:MAG TPA: LysE family translocator [Methylomirabilota bacterium]|nr:LysE family translocator [Methylomirabilota bacterium]
MPFLPELAVIAAYTLAAAFLTLTPGPDMALFLGKTVTGGRTAGFASFLGTTAGLVVHSTLAAAGVAAVLAASATAFTVLKVVGVGYLLYLAYDALRRGSAFAPDQPDREASRREPLLRVFLKGLAVNVLNPKIVMFFVTFLPQFVDAADPDGRGKLFFLGLWYIVVTIPLTVAMILGASGIAGYLRANPRALRLFDYAFAGVMATFAIRLARAHQ